MPQWALGGPKVQPKKPRRALAPQVLEGYRLLGDMFWWLDLFSCWIQAWKSFLPRNDMGVSEHVCETQNGRLDREHDDKPSHCGCPPFLGKLVYSNI